jgi:hypothetical protein
LWHAREDEKQQLSHRLPADFIHRTLSAFNEGSLSAAQACARLEVGRSALYELRTRWLREGRTAAQRLSGGNRREDWPAEVCAFAERFLLECRPVNYCLLAAEAQRRFGFVRDSATWRERLARTHPLLTEAQRPGPKPRRRWARSGAGELIHYDTSPHVWWPGCPHQPLALGVDDATRFIPIHGFLSGETTWEHFRGVRAMIETHGLPEAFYTDALGTFGARSLRHPGDDILSQFQRALSGLGIAHLVARDAQAKGKIERRFRFWQGRLCPLFAFEKVTGPQDAAPLLDAQIQWHNTQHRCRTTGLTPMEACDKAKAEGRWKWRSCPPAALLDLHFALYERRSVNPDHTVSFLGRSWQIAATARRSVTIVHHPQKRFWVISAPPTAARPQWTDILGSYSL